jgi:ribonucleoside-diphosphate reductase alpha chain
MQSKILDAFPGKEFAGSENAKVVLDSRYRWKGPDGVTYIETYEGIMERQAKALGKAEAKFNKDGKAEERRQDYEAEIFALMVNQVFEHNTPTVANAGRPGGQFSACFVQAIEDAMMNGVNGIMDTVSQAAVIHQSGGGTGFNFSRLRPKNDLVGTSRGLGGLTGVASGPVSFLTMYNAVTEQIKQGAMRRGANMGVLNVDHPDIMEFVACKRNNDGKTIIANFNISVNLKNSFMEALKRGDAAYNLINPRTKKEQGSLNPKAFWRHIAEMAHKCADPGVLYLDRANEQHQAPGEGDIEATNPCGEVPLIPNEPCNLGSINLAKLLRMGAKYTPGKSIKDQARSLFDWPLLRAVVRVAIRSLNNVVEENTFPTPQIDVQARRTMKLGLGIMGWADVLLMLRMRYASPEAAELAEYIMKEIQMEARMMSSEIAKERGNCPAWENSVFGPNPEYNSRTVAGGRGYAVDMRNITVTCLAPTGSISMIADASSGCEPIFAVAYVKECLGGKKFPYVDENVMSILAENGVKVDDELRAKLVKVGWLDPDKFDFVAALPQYVKEMLWVSRQIHWKHHIDHQAAFQRYTCLAVSKTINCAENTTVEEIEELYMYAYDKGCKGTTIYRENSLNFQVLHVGEHKDDKSKVASSPVVTPVGPNTPVAAPSPAVPVGVSKRPRPAVVHGATVQVPTGCGPMNVTVNDDEQGEFEIFSSIGKGGGCAAAQTEAQGRLISLALRFGVPYEEIIAQLQGIRCPKPVMAGQGQVTLSCGDAIAKGMKLVHDAKAKRTLAPVDAKNAVPVEVAMPQPSYSGPVDCPEENCGGTLVYGEGCVKCPTCGFSQCGG